MFQGLRSLSPAAGECRIFCISRVVMDLMSFAAVVVACCCCSCSVFRCAYHSTLHVQAARQSSRPPPHPLIPPPPIPAPLLPPPSLPSPRLSSPSSRHPPPTPPPLLSYPVQLPSKLKAPTPGEVEAAKLNVSLGRALENNTALAEAVRSKDDLVKDLNSRIKQVREPRVFFFLFLSLFFVLFFVLVLFFCSVFPGRSFGNNPALPESASKRQCKTCSRSIAAAPALATPQCVFQIYLLFSLFKGG